MDLDPTLRGYHVAWNDGTRYWLPLLGPVPWAVWQTLLSFCFGERDTCWPSIGLVADIAANGNRKLITGRWRGQADRRRRQAGALEILEEAGLLGIETRHSGLQSRYLFHVLKEPPILTPAQLAQLPPRLQQMHAELLARCGMDQDRYQGRAPQLGGRGAQDPTPGAPGPTPGARDTTNHYKEEGLIEEVWRTIKSTLETEISPGNYRTYVADTHPIAFDQDTGTLLVEATSPLAANQLNSHFQMTIRRAVITTKVAIQGVPIAKAEFVPRPQRPWDTEDD